MFNICEMTAFLYLKLDASWFVGRGWWYSRSLERESLYLKGSFFLGILSALPGRPVRFPCVLCLHFQHAKSNMQLMILERYHSYSRTLSWQLFGYKILLLDSSHPPLSETTFKILTIFLLQLDWVHNTSTNMNTCEKCHCFNLQSEWLEMGTAEVLF